MNDFEIIRTNTIETLNHIATIPHLRGILETQLNDIQTDRGYYATGECLNQTCGYPRLWFGKCMAQYKDAVILKHLKEILT